MGPRQELQFVAVSWSPFQKHHDRQLQYFSLLPVMLMGSTYSRDDINYRTQTNHKDSNI